MQLFLLISVALVVLISIIKAYVLLFRVGFIQVEASKPSFKSFKIFTVKTKRGAREFSHFVELYLPLTLVCLALAYQLVFND